MPKKQTSMVYCVDDQALIKSRRQVAGYDVAVRTMTPLPEPVVTQLVGVGLRKVVAFVNNGCGACVMIETTDGGNPIPFAARFLADPKLWEDWTGAPLPEPKKPELQVRDY